MKYELELTVSGMDKAKMDALYEFLDDNEYSYVGRENTYEECESEDEVHMNLEELVMDDALCLTEVKCPKCYNTFFVDFRNFKYEVRDDGDFAIIHCPYCGKEFKEAV